MRLWNSSLMTAPLIFQGALNPGDNASSAKIRCARLLPVDSMAFPTFTTETIAIGCQQMRTKVYQYGRSPELQLRELVWKYEVVIFGNLRMAKSSERIPIGK